MQGDVAIQFGGYDKGSPAIYRPRITEDLEVTRYKALLAEAEGVILDQSKALAKSEALLAQRTADHALFRQSVARLLVRKSSDSPQSLDRDLKKEIEFLQSQHGDMLDSLSFLYERGISEVNANAQLGIRYEIMVERLSAISDELDRKRAELAKATLIVNALKKNRAWGIFQRINRVIDSVYMKFTLQSERKHYAEHIDQDWYLSTYPDVGSQTRDAIGHFLAFGAAEGRDPNPHFSTSWYLRQNPDVAASTTNGLQHFIEFGFAEGRDPHPQVSNANYERLRRAAKMAAAEA